MKAKAVAVLVIASASIVTLVGLGNVWASPPSDPLSDGTPPLMMNYQGVLTDPATGEPAPDGDYEIRFALYDSANEWGSLWTELQTVSVADGLFNVLLGSEKPLSPDHFTGTTYLGVKVGADPWLTPRQRIVSVAYAIHALEAVDSDTVDGKDASAFAATGHTHDSRYWRLTGNAGTTPGTHFLGTTDDVALELRVNGATAIRIEPQGHAPNIIAGHSGNSVTAGAQGAVIGGGRDNSVYDSHGTVGGGDGNQAGDNAGSTDDAVYATVGGGWSNSASGYISTIAGGQHNSASTERATIGGGAHNTADGSYATISGGRFNTAGDGRSTVGGGESNASDGWYSTVAGGRHNVARGNSASVGGGYDNHATADYATIGGGARSDPFDDTSGNRVTDNYGTIGGGGNNQAGDDAGSTEDARYATVGGGQSNSSCEDYATIGGGYSNTARGGYATISGGQCNTAQGWDAAVGGGYSNTAGGQATTIGGGAFNTTDGESSTVGGGLENTANASMATVSGGHWNAAGAYHATVGGGYQNHSDGESATVGGGELNMATGPFTTVAGGLTNSAGGGLGTEAECATVGGGALNTAEADYATVAGGRYNAASGQYATIGGGHENDTAADYATIAGGGPSNPEDLLTSNRVTDNYGTIGGGGNNQAGDDAGSTEDAMYATISGGRSNTAGKRYASVGGGDANAASGQYATVPGGQSNTAQGNYSLAAGHQANALHDSAFVWSDSSTYVEYSSDADHQFRARASGGVYFHSNPFASAGVYLAPGGTSWQAASDRTIKENYAPADGEDILVRLASLPISTWNLKSQDPSIRHIGPVAQDFYAAFGFGESEMAINMEDSGGVALTAIQTLYYRFQEQATRIETLEEENTALRRRLDDLEALVTALASQADGGAR